MLLSLIEMVISTLVLLINQRYILMVLEKWIIHVEMFIKVNGKTEKFMDQEHMNGNQDKNI
jgi:hypothetical protein